MQTESANYSNNKTSNFNQNKIRENTKLRLRKDNIKSISLSRTFNVIRSNIILQSNHEINITNLQLSPSFIAEFNSSTTQLNISLNNLRNEDLNIIKFSLKKIYDFFSCNDNIKESLDRLILPNTTNDILTILIKYADKDNQILYIITRLFMIFSMNSHVIKLQIATGQIISGLYNILTLENLDYAIMNNILCLFGNWLTEDTLFNSITQGCNITAYIFKYIEKVEMHNVPHLIVENCLLIICNLINRNSYPLLKIYLQKALKYIIKYIISDLNQSLFLMALNTLDNIFYYSQEGDFCSDTIEDISFTFIFVDHIKAIESSNDKDHEILLLCLDILINLTFISNEFAIKIVIENNLLSKLDILFEAIKSNLSEYKTVLMKVLDLLINLCDLYKIIDKIVRKSLIIRNLIELLQMDLNKDEYSGIMKVFQNITNTGELISNHYMEFIYLDVPNKVILNTLKCRKDEDVILISLIMAEYFLIFGKDLIQGQNFIRRYYEKIGLDNVIESFNTCINKSIAEIANRITEEYLKA